MPNHPLHDGFCLGHQSTTATEQAILPDIVNSVHATEKLWGSNISREAFLKRIDKAVDDVEIIRGILPDAAWGRLSDTILQNTLLQLDGMDLEAFRQGEDGHQIDMASVREYHSLFDGNWGDGRVRHCCCKRVEQDLVPCCVDAKQTKTRMKAAARNLLVPVFSRVAAGDTTKWCETSRACCILGYFAKCHSFMRTGKQKNHKAQQAQTQCGQANNTYKQQCGQAVLLGGVGHPTGKMKS